MKTSLACLLLSVLPAAAEPFEFLVMGCMPYYMPGDAERFENIIEVANLAKPAFNVHCGDTKFGRLLNDDASLLRVKGWFDRFEQPFVYVPGDNEWTDSHTELAGGYDPLERLAFLRRTFYPAEPRSLGKTSLPLERQNAQVDFADYVEHQRWQRDGLVFATLHVVGSNNNRREDNAEAMAEFAARDRAVLAWMKESFAAAADAKALALFLQANPFDEVKRGAPRSTGFENFVSALRKEVLKYGKPVYLFHADSHYFRIDKPLTSTTGRTIENFTRIETFGGYNLHLIRVQADPDSAEPLRAFPWMVEKNLVDPNTPLPPKPTAATAK
jgi:hypothetical protein